MKQSIITIPHKYNINDIYNGINVQDGKIHDNLYTQSGLPQCLLLETKNIIHYSASEIDS